MNPGATGELPTGVRPMLATLGALPGDDDRWAYETKWDGVRALVSVAGGRVGVRSRNDVDASVAYPELAALGAAVGGARLLLDGEIVAFDSTGRPSFSALQPRMHVADRGAARALAASTPATLVIFDLLWCEGRDVTGLAYIDRRTLLAGLALAGPSWQTPSATLGHGADVLTATRELHLEGVVAKRLASTYRPGRRSPDWIKIKNTATQEVVVGGWTPGQGRRAGGLGALLLGIPEAPISSEGPMRLRYVGKVGTGFSDAVLDALHRRLAGAHRSESPFREQLPPPDRRVARWVAPELVGEVSFSEWTRDGRLRHPAWRGERMDKRAREVVVEADPDATTG